jgi:predicted nucleic acid-binding protein
VATARPVDSNVLLDVLTDDAEWGRWSSDALARVADTGPLCINPVVYAEMSVRFSRIEDVEAALPATDLRRAAVPWEAASLAAKASVGRRRRRGPKMSPLRDFFIWAHAAVAGLVLLTRDAGR